MNKKGSVPQRMGGVVVSTLDELENLAINQEWDWDDDEKFEDEAEEPTVSKKKYDNWSVHGSAYVPNSVPPVTVNHIPSGRYSFAYSDQLGMYLRKVTTSTDELVNLPFTEYDSILSDIDMFWKRGDKYRQYGYIHKRGILLHGPAGSGKSSLVHLIAKNVVEKYNGLVFYIATDSDLEYADSLYNSIFTELEPDRKKVVIIEDIDNFLKGRSSESRLLGLIDGDATMSNTLTIATTNYPEELPDRIKNRPSRFDTVRQIGFPDENVRRFYLEHVIREDDADLVDIEKWIEDTEGFTISHIKELITAVLMVGKEYDQALSDIKSLADNISSRDYKTKRAGF